VSLGHYKGDACSPISVFHEKDGQGWFGLVAVVAKLDTLPNNALKVRIGNAAARQAALSRAFHAV
jgi:hypothetical protein